MKDEKQFKRENYRPFNEKQILYDRHKPRNQYWSNSTIAEIALLIVQTV